MDERRFTSEPENPVVDGEPGSGAPSPEEMQHPASGEGAPPPGIAPQARVVDKRHSSQENPVEPLDLEGELGRARREAAEHLDDLKRLKAEFENYRKRVVREQTALVERAAEQLVERLLPILDNFELALIAADETTNYSKLVRGVELVFGELTELLHREGLQRIDALGKPFDPLLHEAVLEVGGGPPEGEPYVGEVVRNGYRLKDKVVRPAMVKVVRR